jgi:amino acid adenylation domain-containing protein
VPLTHLGQDGVGQKVQMRNSLYTPGHGLSIGAIFNKVAHIHAEKAAIEFGDQCITYAELDLASNVLASRLAAMNLPAAGRAALLLRNRISAITAMLGVLKAGHAYVPLDPADPADRVRFILEDCTPFALITDDEHIALAGKIVPDGCQLINISEGASKEAIPPPVVEPDALAYILYTSGSTGHPKGVCQTHRNAIHFARCYSENLDISDQDRLTLLFSLSFGASNMDIYPGLLNGATLFAYDMRREGIPPLADWLDQKHISVLHAVPSVFRQLMKSISSERVFGTIRIIDLGGDSLSSSDVQSFRQHFSQTCKLVSHLAATEAHVIAQYLISAEQPYSGKIVPAGRSPEGVELDIERADGSKAEVDEVGSLVIASPYVSPGYWKRPELNEAIFSDDPTRPGWRIFRPGDIGRIDRNGILHFMGRHATKAKVRGHTIELAEVEAALRLCPHVEEAAAAVISRRGQIGAEALVAYLVVNSKADRDPKRIRRSLASHLPNYMLPGIYVFLDALPLTASGKLDRSALPDPDQHIGSYHEDYVPPADKLEEKIAGIYQEILKYSPIGRMDDFFLAGGDSMSAIDLQIRLFDAFGKDVPDIFEDATVAGIAKSIRKLEMTPTVKDRLLPVLVPVREKGSGPILFLVHGRFGQAPVSPHLLSLLGNDQPLYVFQARGVDGIQAPNETIEAMAADYLDALRQIQPHGPYFIGALCMGGWVAVEMARKLVEDGESVAPLILVDPPSLPFNPLRAAYRKRELDLHFQAPPVEDMRHYDINDPFRRKGAAQVAKAFENAIQAYALKPYPGPVFLLASTYRLSATEWGDPSKLRAHFAGDVHCLEAGPSHNQIIDSHNEAFVQHFTSSVRAAREAISDLSSPH